MQRLLLIAVIFFISFFVGCRKVGKDQVNGTVTEEGTGLPFPNVGVYMERSMRSGESERTNPRVVAQTITDADGHYHLSFNKEFYRDYRIYCTPIPDGTGDTYSKESSKGLPMRDRSVDFTLPPFAYVKINLHKTSYTVSASSYVQFDYQKTIYLNDPSYPIDTVRGVYRVVGNKSLRISWSQSYNSPPVWHQGGDNVVINKGDTLSYFINLD